jgi:rhomboid protease GluP
MGFLPGLRIDNAAHIGGLVAGFAIAYLAGTQPLYERWTEKLWKLSAACCVLITAAAFVQMLLFLTAASRYSR